MTCLLFEIWPQDEFLVWTRYLPNFQVRYWYLMPIFLCEKSFTQKINFKIVINKNYMVMETKKTLNLTNRIPPHKTPALFTLYLLIPPWTSPHLTSFMHNGSIKILIYVWKTGIKKINLYRFLLFLSGWLCINIYCMLLILCSF